jgi:hypothetical protein
MSNLYNIQCLKNIEYHTPLLVSKFDRYLNLNFKDKKIGTFNL